MLIKDLIYALTMYHAGNVEVSEFMDDVLEVRVAQDDHVMFSYYKDGCEVNTPIATVSYLLSPVATVTVRINKFIGTTYDFIPFMQRLKIRLDEGNEILNEVHEMVLEKIGDNQNG